IAALNHPHICTIYDVGPNYIVMEHLNGETLRERITRGALPMPEVLRLGIQLTSALAEAHSRGIVHRDLKPRNIMLTDSGLKVTEFGLARMSDSEADRLTQTNAVMGTPAYMAPEQINGGGVGAAADLFSLGLVLFEMATGSLPLPGASLGRILAGGSRTPPA